MYRNREKTVGFTMSMKKIFFPQTLIGMPHAMTLCCIFDINKSASRGVPIVFEIALFMLSTKTAQKCVQQFIK